MSNPADNQTTAASRPPRGTKEGTWHWLKHELDGEVQVMQWCGDQDDCWKMIYFDDPLDAARSFGWTYIRPIADEPPQ